MYMKRIQLLFLCIMLTTFSACKKNELSDVKPVTLSLKIALDESVINYNFSPANTEIKLTNLINGQVNKLKTDDKGMLNIASLSPGDYDIEATLVISANDYSTITGDLQTEDVTFSGLLKGQSIVKATNDLILKINTGRIGDWVFKQIYYAGSHTSNGALFRDVFFEIYNNSNELMYADSLYFSQAFGLNTKTTSLDASLTYLRPNKQYDWSKSIGNNVNRANEDYIYAKTMYMIPGTGKSYPVKPGESLIIAATAINHKAPYTNLEGIAVTVKDPSLTVDLSKADFEVYLGNEPGINPLATDIDNPAVPNLKVISRGGDRDLILQPTGRDAYVIFKTNEDINNFAKIPTPEEKEINITTNLYIRVPSKYILDAVETQPPVVTNQFPKKLESSLDATFTFVKDGQYSSQSLIRKTAKIVNGRRILKDTNSSSNDFETLDRPDVTKTVFK